MAPRHAFQASSHLLEFPNAYFLNYPNSTPHGQSERAFCDNYQTFPYQNLHIQTHNAPYFCNQHSNHMPETATHPPAENSSMQFKRTLSLPVYESSNGHHFAESSSIALGPSNHAHLKPALFCTRPMRPNGCNQRYPEVAFLFAPKGYQRNVRIRHDNRPQADMNPALQFSCMPAFVGGQWCHTYQPGLYYQWNHSTISGFSGHAMNRPLVSRNRASSSVNGRSSYIRAPNLLATALEGNDPSGSGHVALPIITNLANSQNGPINQAPGNFNTGCPLFNMENARHRWVSQGLHMMDSPPLGYELDLLDEHNDLRLEIDGLSYEELLSLEEMIGSVNTGLSEDNFTFCLAEKMYSLSGSDQEEASCPICLEEFMDGDSQGIMKCHHAYHAACIKNWLRIKNACPICKAPPVNR